MHPLQPLLQAHFNHLAEPGPPHQGGQFIQVGSRRDLEVFHEAGGDALRARAQAPFVVVQQVAAEAAHGSGHSNNLLPVSFWYISTMNRLAFRVRGPSGRVPTRNWGSSST